MSRLFRATLVFAVLSFAAAPLVGAGEGDRSHSDDHAVVLSIATGSGELPVIFENQRLVAEAKLFLTGCAQQVLAWGSDSQVADAVVQRNAAATDVTRARQIDAQWSAGAAESLQQELTLKPCSVALRRAMGAEPEKQYQHAFATDLHGAIVCMSDKTKRYWHGGDLSWVRAFNDGDGAVFVSRPRIDENIAQPLVHIAVPIVKEARVIGVLVVGKGVHNTKAGERPAAPKPKS